MSVEVGHDVTKLLQVLNDLDKHREHSICHLQQELPFLRSAHSLLGIIIHRITNDTVDLRPFVQAAE